ncbi:hypothetical protein LVD15_24020 [Fulvivirga maritima]|uniref:hypothetical protein n=1 Tax=Fulvivirga maritima TaxID=2904247 RepID=UPI001F1B95DA|nr:hypothetical protein [Fulvivirga maritima]UII26327.1 hypothetical protein LVD15_24020 [Fulvivirga maritima]
MFSIEVISNDLRWIAAIYEQPSEGDKYLEELISFGHKPKVVEITNISTFPVYAIERMGEESPANYFEYLSESEYLQLIEYQQKNRSINDNYEAYFTVFFFQDAHFQHPYENSLMGALDHVHVSNYYLDGESANLSLNDTYIDRLVNNYDIEALFNLFEKLKNSSDEEAKTNLADGLVSLYAQMDYDHACGKLTTEGINSLLPILERAELLYDKPIDDCFSRAYLIMLEESVKNNAPEEEIKKFMEKAIEVNESIMHTSPEEQQDAYKQLAMVFETILEHKPSANYLEQAYLNIRKSIATAPTNGDWELYLKSLVSD